MEGHIDPVPTDSSSLRRRFSADPTGSECEIGKRPLSAGWNSPRRYRWLTVVISVFAVFILLTSGIGIVRANTTSGGAAAPPTSPAAPPTSSFNPYSANLSAWPTPDTLPNVTGTLSLPRISSLTLGATFVYVLVFVEVVPSKGTILESDTGTYSPTLAGAIAVGNGCADNCTQHLPIAWNVPTPVAVYGGSPIQSDALAVLSTIDVGPSFRVDILVSPSIGTLTGLAIQALMNSVGSAFSTLTSSSIYALESYINATLGPQIPGGTEMVPAVGSGSNQESWTTVALIASTLLEFKIGFPWSLYEIEQANGLGGAFASGAISLALGIVGIILFVAHLVEPVPAALLILGVAFGAFSLVKTLYFLTSAKTLPSLKPILTLNAVMQSGNLAGALYGLTQAL